MNPGTSFVLDSHSCLRRTRLPRNMNQPHPEERVHDEGSTTSHLEKVGGYETRASLEQPRERDHPMDPIQFVEQHGVVLEGGRGPRPNLAEAVAGEHIDGNWWGHVKARAIFRATRTARDSDQVLVCRLVDGKITYVHRRLWPAIVCLAKSLDKKSISALREEHSPSGAHIVRAIPFPRWVPTDVRRAAKSISEEQACLQLGEWIQPYLRQRRKQLSKDG